MVSKNNDKNIVIVTHKFLPFPDDDLVYYLNKKLYKNVLHINHYYGRAKTRKSICTWYQNGREYKIFKSPEALDLPEFVMYLKEFFYTELFVFKSKLKIDYYIGLDGLCTFFGLVSRFFGRVEKVVYWSMDFVPSDRFSSWFKNKTYRVINTLGYKKADELWDLSPRMVEARKVFWNLEKPDKKRHKLVVYGAWIGRVKRYSYEECEKSTLVFMGNLLEKQGVQLVIDAIPEIIKQIPDFKFKIIGSGKFKPDLEKKIHDMKLENYCKFFGAVEDSLVMENEIAKSCVAIAPYVARLDTWTKYADPGKIKTYLACGVPVLLTDVPWNAKEIEKIECGKIITENPENIAENVIMLMNEDLNQKFRNNAVEYSKGFDYNKIFNSLL